MYKKKEPSENCVPVSPLNFTTEEPKKNVPFFRRKGRFEELEVPYCFRR